MGRNHGAVLEVQFRIYFVTLAKSPLLLSRDGDGREEIQNPGSRSRVSPISYITGKYHAAKSPFLPRNT
jgi:hypothetical protein